MFLEMCRDGMEADLEDRFCGLGSLVLKGIDDNMIGGIRGAEEGPKHVPGITNLGILGAQNLESKALRRHLGLEELDLSGGVRIVGSRLIKEQAVAEGDNEENHDAPGKDTESTLSSILQCNDVLLAINDTPIGTDGTIQLSSTRLDERINFRVLVTSEKVGTKVTLDVLRSKKRQKLDITLDSMRFVVPSYDDFDASPMYAVCGGCVFGERNTYYRLPIMRSVLNELTFDLAYKISTTHSSTRQREKKLQHQACIQRPLHKAEIWARTNYCSE